MKIFPKTCSRKGVRLIALRRLYERTYPVASLYFYSGKANGSDLSELFMSEINYCAGPSATPYKIGSHEAGAGNWI